MITISDETFNAGISLGLDNDIMYAYAASLKQHINYVVQAATEVLGMDIGEVEYHDLSKWHPEEFPFYAKHFHGGGDPIGFSHAWHHHMRNNPHHWQYWMFPDGYSMPGSDVVNGCLPMPPNYVLEMVADWMGASMAYTGSWNMSDWLAKNFSKVRMHPDSKYGLVVTLQELGYKVLVKNHTDIPTPSNYENLCNFSVQ